MQSKITGGATTMLFNAKVLNKYNVQYYRCNETGFIQTEEPYWLDEAYASAITKLDVGLVSRNIKLSKSVSKILALNFDTHAQILDYAGGYGLFTRLMRDKGFAFYHTDKFCENIFAEYFDLADLPEERKFELVTAFEVFEHLPGPIPGIQEMLMHSGNLLFTTELQPPDLKRVDDWWYFSLETGQHIALYTEASLQYIAGKLGYNFYTDGLSLHLFTKKIFAKNPVMFEKEPFFTRKARKYITKADQTKYGKRESLLQTDWQHIKDKLNSTG